jgi:hypothetical protein
MHSRDSFLYDEGRSLKVLKKWGATKKLSNVAKALNVSKMTHSTITS